MYDTLYAILDNSENATLQYFIFCKKALDEKYLLKLNNVFKTSSKWFVEAPPICLGPVFWTLKDSDQHSFQIFLCHIGVPTFSWQNKVIKVCPKYLLTFYYN